MYFQENQSNDNLGPEETVFYYFTYNNILHYRTVDLENEAFCAVRYADDGIVYHKKPLVKFIALGSKLTMVHNLIHSEKMLEEMLDWQPTALLAFKAIMISKMGWGLPIDTKRFMSSTESKDGYYFCPRCFEGNQKSHLNDMRTICSNCQLEYNINMKAS